MGDMSDLHARGTVAAVPPRTCVYTALIGRYERLNEQPVAARSAWPFICLTDDPTLRSDTWQVRLVQPVFAMDPVRSARELKIRPHLHLADVDQSLYIDNSVLLRAPPEAIVARHAGDAPMALPRHSYRDSTMDEFLEVSRLGYDDQGRIFEQLNHYLLACPEVLAEVPYWTAILWRDHRHPQVRDMAERWAAQVHRYSRRDQLSVNAALAWAGLSPAVIDIDNRQSWCHGWPVTPERDRDAGPRLAGRSLLPLPAQLHQAQQQLAQAQAAQAALQAALDAQRQQQDSANDALAAQRAQNDAPRLSLHQQAQQLAALQEARQAQPATWPQRLAARWHKARAQPAR
jgi:hypothetical protein